VTGASLVSRTERLINAVQSASVAERRRRRRRDAGPRDDHAVDQPPRRHSSSPVTDQPAAVTLRSIHAFLANRDMVAWMSGE